MKFPLSWLREIIPLKQTSDEIAQILVSLGIEIDSMTPLSGKETLFEASFTYNLNFAMSILGLARELRAVTGEKLRLPDLTFKEEKRASPLSVTVLEEELAPKVSFRVVEGVKSLQTPHWLKERLEQFGLRSVNAVVDVTNYVMIELGQPLHAYDLAKVAQEKLVIRRAKSQEKITLLDGKEHFLTEETLVIADAHAPLAVAGVMGGNHAEVDATTERVAIEAAYFDPLSIRRTAKRMGLSTEASRRFEKGCDPNGLEMALERACHLLQQMEGAKPLQGRVDAFSKAFPPKKLFCRPAKLNDTLGVKWSLGEMEELFRRLDMKLLSSSQEKIELLCPTYRTDLNSEIDLIEEAARLYGYDLIYQKRSAYYARSSHPHNPLFLFEREVRQLLLGQGLQEMMSSNLIGPKELASQTSYRSVVRMLNPVSSEMSILRPSLLPSMLKNVQENVRHKRGAIAAFEVGKIHFQEKERFIERTSIAILLMGERAPLFWGEKSRHTDYYDVKGIVENLLTGLRIDVSEMRVSKNSDFHPWRQEAILVDNKEVGLQGELSPSLLHSVGIHTPIYYAELLLDDLFLAKKREHKMTPLPQFPSSDRDWTLSLPQEVEVKKILDAIASFAPPLLENFSLVDLYLKDQLGSVTKNLTFHFVYRDRTKTVSHEEVERVHTRFIEQITKDLK